MSRNCPANRKSEHVLTFVGIVSSLQQSECKWDVNARHFESRHLNRGIDGHRGLSNCFLALNYSVNSHFFGFSNTFDDKPWSHSHISRTRTTSQDHLRLPNNFQSRESFLFLVLSVFFCANRSFIYRREMKRKLSSLSRHRGLVAIVADIAQVSTYEEVI